MCIIHVEFNILPHRDFTNELIYVELFCEHRKRNSTYKKMKGISSKRIRNIYKDSYIYIYTYINL